MRLAFAACLFLTAPAQARTVITYNSGTGFFVNQDGYILTNNHVVERCRNYSIYGAVTANDAQLIAQDGANDLALLKTDAAPQDAAMFASGKRVLRPGDPVVIVGYPGQSWQNREAQVAQAQIVDTKGPRGEEKWIEFSDSLSQGNSGGPLLDSSGNVIGVVSAKARAYSFNEAGAREDLVHKFDIAVSEIVMRRFLDGNRIAYREADSGIYLSADRVADAARRFIVNIRCKIQ